MVSLIPQAEPPLLDLVIRSLAVTVLFGALVLLVKPSPDVDQLAQKVFSRYLKR